MSVQFTLKPRFEIVAIAVAISLALRGGSVRAQDADGAPPDQSQNGRQASGDHFVIGLGAAYAPAYEGASKYRALPLPVVDIKWGPLFANLSNGIGLDIIDTKYLTAGTGITYLPGYRAQDVPPGIGKLEAGAGGRVFVSLKAAGFIETIGAAKTISGGTLGTVVDASLSRPVAMSQRLTIIPTIGLSWADSKYNDRYFGVNAWQSLASGLPEFEPGTGFKDASVTLSANYRLSSHISVGISTGASTLLGKVKDSPIVFHQTQPSSFLSMSYRFGS